MVLIGERKENVLNDLNPFSKGLNLINLHINASIFFH